MLRIRAARDSDEMAISVLLVSTFEQPNESTLVKDLRAEGRVAVELVAEDDKGLVGHICLSHLLLPEGWLTLAPVSVRTAQQNRGIGGELVRYALDQARQQHFAAVVVVGNPDYYTRFGFVFDGPSVLSSPYPAQYTGLFPISPESAAANVTLVYPGPFERV